MDYKSQNTCKKMDHLSRFNKHVVCKWVIPLSLIRSSLSTAPSPVSTPNTKCDLELKEAYLYAKESLQLTEINQYITAVTM